MSDIIKKNQVADSTEQYMSTEIAFGFRLHTPLFSLAKLASALAIRLISLMYCYMRSGLRAMIGHPGSLIDDVSIHLEIDFFPDRQKSLD